MPEYPLQGPLRPRASIEEGFPPLPKVLCDTCRVLRGSHHLTGEERAHRAWRAGCWARAVLDAQAESPNHSVGLGSQTGSIVSSLLSLDRPTVVHTFAAYKALVGELRKGGSISHAFPSEAEARIYFCRREGRLPVGLMDFLSLPAAEAGQVTLLEFTWPWPPGGTEDPVTCIAYVVLKRASCFILCLPTGYLPAEALQEAPAVRLTPAAEWIAAEAEQTIRSHHRPAGRVCPGLVSARPGGVWGLPFSWRGPRLVPSGHRGVPPGARVGGGCAVGCPLGYQTAVPKGKRPTVATLAQDQAALQELVRGLAKQIAGLLPPAVEAPKQPAGTSLVGPPGLVGPQPVVPPLPALTASDQAAAQGSLPCRRSRGPACTYHWRRRRSAATCRKPAARCSCSGCSCPIECSRGQRSLCWTPRRRLRCAAPLGDKSFSKSFSAPRALCRGESGQTPPNA